MIATASAKLHRAILLDPADDTARLAYSDALEEEGQDEQAEFVRVQVEIARTNARSSDGCVLLPGNTCTGRSLAVRRHRLGWKKVWCASCRPKAGLLIRERRLLDADPENVHATHGGNAWQWSGAGTGLHQMTDARWTFRRGFVAKLSCPAADFLTHPAGLFAAHPVERVMLTDAIERFETYVKYACVVRTDGWPEELVNLLWLCLPKDPMRRWEINQAVFFADAGEAEQSVSRACVAYGRRAAGLPDYDWPRREGA